MIQITQANNTFSPALQVLVGLGYTVKVENEDENTSHNTWIAEKDGERYFAYDPLSLLGLQALGQARGEQWRLQSDENKLYSDMLANLE